MTPILKTKDLCKFYGSGENLVKAVDHVNLEITQGEFVTIVGKSGSGKSTLLHLLGALENPTSGEILMDGKISRAFPRRNSPFCAGAGSVLSFRLST